MFSARAILGSIVTAILTGAVGFGSAYYLQERESKARLAEQASAHQLELQRNSEAAQTQQQRDRELLAAGLYQSWMSDPLASQAHIARRALDRYPRMNYADILANPSVSESEREALRAVLRFWRQVDDLVADNSVSVERVAQRLGPDAMGWSPYVTRLATDLDPQNVQAAYAVYAASGVQRVVTAREEQQKERVARSLREPPAAAREP